jgi:predicted alpha/beta hydrolase family esterase
VAASLDRGGVGAERLLLVAPPSEQPPLESFFPAPLPEVAGDARLVCSDDDPYCPEGAESLYGAPLGIPVDIVPRGGHLNPDAGFGPWPEVEAWCLDQRASVAGSGAKKGIET